MKETTIRAKLLSVLDGPHYRFWNKLDTILIYAMQVAMNSLEGRDIYYDGKEFFTKPGMCEQPPNTVHILFIAGGGVLSLSDGVQFDLAESCAGRQPTWVQFIIKYKRHIIEDVVDRYVYPTKVGIDYDYID
jgi:hypothetical protein